MYEELKDGEFGRPDCDKCNCSFADILIVGKTSLNLCLDCSKQVARYLLEDICALDTKGGRHG